MLLVVAFVDHTVLQFKSLVNSSCFYMAYLFYVFRYHAFQLVKTELMWLLQYNLTFELKSFYLQYRS